MKRTGRWIWFWAMLFVVSALFFPSWTAAAEEPLRVEFFYQEVCATCDGTEEFYEIYNHIFTYREKAKLNAEIVTYNVFLESNEDHYRQVAEEKGIPDDTSFPVLVTGDEWVSGYDAIESSLKDMLQGNSRQDDSRGGKGTVNPTQEEGELADGEESEPETEPETGTKIGETAQAAVLSREAAERIGEEESVALILFTTNFCEECESVKEWIREQVWLEDTLILEYNIIEDNSLDFLKKMFRTCQVEESCQEVPAVFAGNIVLTGGKEIRSLTAQRMEDLDNQDLLEILNAVQIDCEKEENSREDVVSLANILTLAGAGLLAGFNPCSISMLLMLLSLVLSAKASVLRSGLMFLAGKYVAYFAIGMAIYLTASQVFNGTLEHVGWMLNRVLAVLFIGAAIFYTVDGVKIFRKDYGHIRTQLPAGLRKANHRLIRKISGMSSVMQPLLILGLGIAIALGEFFCTGQIYMASITYMLKDGEAAVWLPFVVYVTAMSLPAVCMIFLIQKTRNTDRISEFMFRHLGMIKIMDAVLFVCFAVYFLIN